MAPLATFSRETVLMQTPPDCSLRTRSWSQSDRSFRTVVWSRQHSLALVWLAWFGLTCAYFKCHGLQLLFTIINLNRGVLMERFFGDSVPYT